MDNGKLLVIAAVICVLLVLFPVRRHHEEK